MKIAKQLVIVFSFVFFVSIALDVQAETHRKPLQGKVLSVEGDTLIVLPDPVPPPEPIKVTIIDQTKLTKNNQPSGKEELKKGSSITLNGTKLTTGEFVAKQINIVGGSHDRE